MIKISNIFKKKDNSYKNFKVTNYVFLEEIQSALIELVHIPSNAQIMHIANGDTENLFSLSFKTLPTSSNGVSHILEHCVLCGSKKFPVKDPFFSMIRRSLNTFMNAMTGFDFTCYPASSQLEKDFYNLLDVYTDSVFNPILDKRSFLQEGYRLEFKDPKNLHGLQYKGIVFNEMKGALTSIDDRLWHLMLEKLTPDLPYCYNSGGDPKEIPNLTYEEFIKFHKTNYHPSVCLFFFYGNIPLEKHLNFLERNVLKNVTKKTFSNTLKKQKRFASPITHTDYYPIEANTSLIDKDIISFGWLTTSILNQKDVLALVLIDLILMENDASPLKYALLKSGLCSEIESFIDTDMTEIPWVIICRGASKKNKDKLFQIILNTLNRFIEEKTPKNLIQGAMHQLEFSRLEIIRTNAPYGLSLFFRAALAKQHGCSAENNLKIHSLFKQLNKDLQNPHFLTDLIKKYIIFNPHLVKLSFLPDPNLEKIEKNQLEQKLKKTENNLTQKEKKDIVTQVQDLKKLQKQYLTQSIECLPKIEIKDIPKKSKYYPLDKEKHKNFEIFFHDSFTNNIVYTDLLFNIPDIKDEDLPYLSFFSLILSELGCGNRSYKKNLEYINLYIGSISSYISLHIQTNDDNTCFPCLAIRGKSLYRNSDKLFSLLKDMATSCDFSDVNRIKELLLQQYTMLIHSINQEAMGYCVSCSVSALSIPSYINDKLHGLPYVTMIKKIVENIDQNLPLLIDKLKQLQSKIFYHSPIHLVVCCDSHFYQKLKKDNFYSLFDMNLKPSTAWTNNFKVPSPTMGQGKIIASPVAFTSMAFKTIGFNHPQAPALLLATSIFENKILIPKIREQGGAYGAGANFNFNTGCFHFFAYRDPSLANTVEIFVQAIKSLSQTTDPLQETAFQEASLQEAKLQIIQHMDTPVALGKKAIRTYFSEKTGKTKESIQKFRENILNQTANQIREAIYQNLFLQIDKAKIVSFSGKDLLEKENAKLLKPLCIQSI